HGPLRQRQLRASRAGEGILADRLRALCPASQAIRAGGHHRRDAPQQDAGDGELSDGGGEGKLLPARLQLPFHHEKARRRSGSPQEKSWRRQAEGVVQVSEAEAVRRMLLQPRAWV